MHVIVYLINMHYTLTYTHIRVKMQILGSCSRNRKKLEKDHLEKYLRGKYASHTHTDMIDFCLSFSLFCTC